MNKPNFTSKEAAKKLKTAEELVRDQSQQRGDGRRASDTPRTPADCLNRETGEVVNEDYGWRVRGAGVVGLRYKVVAAIEGEPGYFHLAPSSSAHPEIKAHISKLEWHIPSGGRLLR